MTARSKAKKPRPRVKRYEAGALTVRLDQDLVDRLARQQRATGKPWGEIARDALRRDLPMLAEQPAA